MADELLERGEGKSSEAESGSVARLRVPQRDQVEMHFASLDEMLESDHPGRVVWELVQGLDLSA